MANFIVQHPITSLLLWCALVCLPRNALKTGRAQLFYTLAVLGVLFSTIKLLTNDKVVEEVAIWGFGFVIWMGWSCRKSEATLKDAHT